MEKKQKRNHHNAQFRQNCTISSVPFPALLASTSANPGAPPCKSPPPSALTGVTLTSNGSKASNRGAGDAGGSSSTDGIGVRENRGEGGPPPPPTSSSMPLSVPPPPEEEEEPLYGFQIYGYEQENAKNRNVLASPGFFIAWWLPREASSQPGSDDVGA